MKINFNNVRMQACYAHDRLVKYLNACNDHEGYLLVDPELLDKHLNDLRQMIGSIAMTFEEGSEDFKDVYQEIYPEPKTMETFNYEEDEP